MSVVDTAKIVGELVKKGATIELQEKIMQLRQEALDLQEENHRLGTENLELKKRIELQETVKFDRRVYWRDGDEVPFCPYCYEKHKLLVHLSGGPPDPDIPRDMRLFYRCQNCRAVYETRRQDDFRFDSYESD